MKINYPYCINLDWLEVFCISTSETKWNDNKYFKLSVKDYGTQQYNNRAEIFALRNGIKTLVATMLWCPRLSVMRTDSVHIKIDNSQLYCKNYFKLLQQLITSFNLVYQGITRVDVAYDCNKLRGGIVPHKLLQDYINDKVLKIGNNRPIVNYRTMGYLLSVDSIGKPKQLNKSAKIINAITWGSRKSGIVCQIYNKSLELKEEKYKPYIVDCWRAAGLDEHTVWRVEIRIQGKGKDIMQLDCNDMFQIGVTDIIDEDKIQQLFWNYALKYCRFVKADYHIKKSQMKEVPLFCITDTPTFRPKFNRVNISGNRTFKTVANVIDTVDAMLEDGRLAPDISTKKEPLINAIHYLSNFIRDNFQEIVKEKRGRIGAAQWYNNICNSILYNRDKETFWNIIQDD